MSKFLVAILVPFPRNTPNSSSCILKVFPTMITTSNPLLLAHFGERVSFVTVTRHQVIQGPQRAYFVSAQVVKPDDDEGMEIVGPKHWKVLEWCRWWYFTQLDVKGNGVNDFKIVLKHQNQQLWKPWGFGVRRRLWQGLKRGFPGPAENTENKCCCLHHIIGDFSYPAALRVSIVDQRFLLSKSRCVLMIFQKGIYMNP